MHNASKRLPNTIKHLILSIGAFILLGVFFGYIFYESTKVTVSINQNGENETITTHSNTVGDLIDTLGIEVGEHDDLSHQLDERLENGMQITYTEAKKVLVTIDDEDYQFETTAETVDQFLEEKSLTFQTYDEKSFTNNDRLESGDELIVTTAFPITIQDGDETFEVWSTGERVETLLQENDIEIHELDKIQEKDDMIQITRVEKTTDVVEERVAFETETRQDATLTKGSQKVIAEGQEGIIEKKYEITLENGVETKRALIEENVKVEKQNKVIAVGTKEPEIVTLASTKSDNADQSSQSSSNSTPPSSGKTFEVVATAYTADCNGCSGYTATGINLKENRHKKVIAVDPKIIPLGSTVWVEGYGTAIAADTGGSIQGYKIDVHVPTKTEARAFGRKTLQVKILD